MKHILIALSLMLSSVMMNAQVNPQNANPNAPVFSFTEVTHDFGSVKEGVDVTTDFSFTNTGKEPLVITNCTASCGCTTPNWSRDPILPGQRGKISVKYDSKKVGTFDKAIYIASNAKGEMRYELHIKGNVVPAQ
jgi:hypothetical protein